MSLHREDYLALPGKVKDAVVAHPVVATVVAVTVALAVGRFLL